LFIFGEIKNIQEGDLLKLTTGATLIFGAVMIAQISSMVKN
jgi:hypothetical protein